MKIIRGQQFNSEATKTAAAPQRSAYSNGFIELLKENNNWMQARGEEILQAFMLPPLQVVAAAINFCILLISGHHLFELPLKNFNDVIDSKKLFSKIMHNDNGKPVNPLYAVKENAL